MPVSCALTVGYEGYEKVPANPDGGGTAGDSGSGGSSRCFPIGCGAPGAKCGTVADQCGDTITCPACPPGQTCAAGECKAQADCGNGDCEAGESCATCVDCKCDDSICVGTTCCIPDCTGKACGADGCGSVCAYCPDGMQCNVNGQCIGQANCGDDTCGNGPGETCESCSDCVCDTGVSCLNQTCCAPDCSGKDCGDDGCGHSCGDCMTKGEVCDPKGQCVPQATCGDEKCDEALGENCNLCQGDCPCMSGSCTPAGTCCTPQCAGKECGLDQCGSLCGSCTGGETCDASGQCVMTCGDGTCSSAETCSSCAADCGCTMPKVCSGGGCCTPNCAGKACGPDGCGGMCPPGCPTNFGCQNGACVQTNGCGDNNCTPPENCATCATDCPTPMGLICCATGPFAGQTKECCSHDDCPYDPQLCSAPTCTFGTCGFQLTCIPGSECCNGGICDPFPCNTGGIGGFSGFPSVGGQTFQSRGWDPSSGGAPSR